MLKDGGENKDSKLVLWKLEEIAKNYDVSVFYELWVAIFDHPLNDSTAVLVNTVLYQVRINHFNDVFNLLRLSLASHDDKNLLNHMISVEVERAFFDSVIVDKLKHHSLLLLKLEHLEASLDDSASMLVSWVLHDFAYDVLKDDVQVFDFNTRNLLYFLYDVITEGIHH